MTKNSKHKLLFKTLLLTMLLISSACTVLSLSLATAKTTISDKALSFMKDVLMLDLSKYQVALLNVSKNPHNSDDSSLIDLIALPTEHMIYALDSGNSKVTANCGFVNESLTSCTIYYGVGLPIYAQPSVNMLDMVKGVLERYQAYSGAPYIQSMRSILEAVSEIENTIVTSANVKLRISTAENLTVISWMYTCDGVDFPSKSVSIVFEQGFMRFNDVWDFYNVGGTSVNVSLEEAMRFAREYAENTTFRIYKGNLTWVDEKCPIMDEPKSAELRSEVRAPLTLYPCWHVQMNFDKVYYPYRGVAVDFWADTKEVIRCYGVAVGGGVPAELREETPGFFASQAQNVSYPQNSTAPQQALSVLANVVGLDMATQSKVTLVKYRQDSYLGVLSQENVRHIVESDASKLEVSCEFVNNTLRMIYVSDFQCSPRRTQTFANVVDAAKGFLSNYQAYAGASYCETLKSMLDSVDGSKSVTKTSDNAILEVTVYGNSASFRWIYMHNGVAAPSKAIGLGFEDGFLKYFVDDWGLYTIGSWDINLSEQEAISIAMNATQSYSWRVWMGEYAIDVTEFEISKFCGAQLTFLNGITEKDARDGDPLTLYPNWRIRLALDKTYPGNVYGLMVDVWADTKSVSQISTATYMGAQPSDESAVGFGFLSNDASVSDVSANQLFIIGSAFSVLVATILSITIGCLRKNRGSLNFQKMIRPVSLKSAVLLWLLVSLITVAIPIRVAGADLADPRGKSVAYGITWGITQDERWAAGNVTQFLCSGYAYQDYNVTNSYGSGTKKSNVLGNVSIMAYGYHRVALFHYGHGGYLDLQNPSGRHWDYFDNYGWETLPYQIRDYEVYDETGLGKHFFVFLWVCRQGDVVRNETSGGGMPYAWTHYNLSPHGFNDSDNSLYCFIGFKDASVPLDQVSQDNYGTSYRYKDWLIEFYDYALNDDLSIRDSLNSASVNLFHKGYTLTELWEGGDGFWAIWPEVEGWGGEGRGWMKIYGNSRIHFNQMEWQLNVYYNGHIPNKDVCVDLPYNLANTGSPMLLNEGYHTVFVNDFWGSNYDGYRYGFEYYFDGEEILTYDNPVYGYFDPSLGSVTGAQFGLAWNPFDIDGSGYFTWDDVYLYENYAINYIPNSRGDTSFTYNSRYDLNADGDVDWDDYDVFWYWVYQRLY
ncbi:MAG: hypothetical protein QXU99_07545 [Candidatus Bathyarchaeia archaeon]